MIAKFDAANGISPAPAPAPAAPPPPAPAPAPAPQRPAHVPEKFWNADKGEVNLEALAKSYTELETKLAKPPAAPAPAPAQASEPKTTEGEQAPPETKPTELTEDQKAAQAAVEKAGLDTAALVAEFAQTGDISPESREALEKVGFGKDVVDSYIAGQKAIAAQRDAEAVAVIGGQEQWDTIASWANANLSAAEHEAFNKAMTGTLDSAKLAMQGLRAKYEAANGNAPALTLGSSGAAPASQGFASRSEMTAAINDKRYATDPSYRAQVEARIVASDSFF